MSTPPSPTSQQPLNEPVSRQPQHKEPASASGVIDAFFEQNPSVAADADNLVVFYRRYQEQHCPMLVGHTEAASLRRENDVLFMAILMAGSFHDHSQQERIASCCVDLIMENIQQQEKRNFKLLEGINCFLAWYTFIPPPYLTGLPTSNRKFPSKAATFLTNSCNWPGPME